MLINFIQWSLTDKTATALSSTDLPTTAPVLTDWNDENSLLIEGKSPSNPDQTCRIKAQVTKATKGKVIDLHGAENGTPSIIIPYQYNILFKQFWMKLFERFPHAFPILRHLMGY